MRRETKVYNKDGMHLSDMDVDQIIAMRSLRTELEKQETMIFKIEPSISDYATCYNCDKSIGLNKLRFKGII
jgi:RNA polymerase-binding transcription factor DksA